MAELRLAVGQLLGLGHDVVPKGGETRLLPAILALVDRHNKAPLVAEDRDDGMILDVHFWPRLSKSPLRVLRDAWSGLSGMRSNRLQPS